MEEQEIREAIERIRKMEQCFDALQKAANERPAALREDGELGALLHRLTAYYEGGRWLADYELDEKGLLPPCLKRGVLAQDAVYAFLERIANTEG